MPSALQTELWDCPKCGAGLMLLESISPVASGGDGIPLFYCRSCDWREDGLNRFNTELDTQVDVKPIQETDDEQVHAPDDSPPTPAQQLAPKVRPRKRLAKGADLC